MRLARTRAELVRALDEVRPGGRLALVPTMGSLHDGHLSLVDRALEVADTVAASVFVNPLQFAPGEDFERYPRSEARDLTLLRDRGAHLAFVPAVEVIYPDGEPRVTVRPGPLADRLCGAVRPGHFEGVLTVVAKLFGLFRPDVAVFGAKDYQQAVLVRRMVLDLDLGVEIVMAPIVREPDGLAMSSRNAYLSATERAQALGLSRALETVARAFAAGERRASALQATLRREVSAHPGLALQYAEIVDPATLEPVDPAPAGAVAAVAAHCGRTRLIDNRVLGA